MMVLEYKKHFINMRPHLWQLDLKFNDVHTVISKDFVIGGKPHREESHLNAFNNGDVFMGGSKNNLGNVEKMGTLLAISSSQYVTICLLKPYFEVLMVYDKDKHGKNIRK